MKHSITFNQNNTAKRIGKIHVLMAALLNIGLATQVYADECVTKTGGSLKTGALIGHTDKDSTSIWVYARDKHDSVRVQYKTDSNGKQCDISSAPPRDDRSNTSLANLKRLKSNTRYYYDILINNKIAESGTFKTAGDDKQFKYAIASCIRFQQDDEQVAFSHIKNKNPDVMLLLGDTVYSHTTNRSKSLNDYHTKQRDIKHFKNIIKDVPTYAIWDDHDFGQNNAEGTSVDRSSARKAFMDVWSNPGYGKNDQGIYYSFTRGDVEFFMLDGRYFKKFGKDFLGKDQLEWLKGKLNNSNAVFKVLAVGQTFNSAGEQSWSDAGSERKELLNFIKDKKIKGVILHSGDVHSNRYVNHKQRRDIEVGYPIIEIVSSGVAMNGGGDWAMIEVDTSHRDRKDDSLTVSFYINGELKPADNESVKGDAKIGPVIKIKGSELGY